ncbi:hypothetical protein GQ597_10595 [Gilliamella sp. Pra-s65]|uniref:hypothetical protein n=1 Tax=unclassified Gilliamella TaxID=2685620 RepID=UPI001365878D|nr:MULTISPECIES: hypothetical protein [unclassified Gilliamella]MWN91151.1 hypothetical protein [Gilliamella sp. Pra-s65]MWP74024.1 hypothetical protein [Gilliamella sp. Pra-s52]
MKKFLELLNKKGIKYLIQDNKITVDGNLNLRNRGIKALPENLSINGDLILTHTKIEALPKNFSISGSLNLANTEITALPESLSVKGDLNLTMTKIKVLPENLFIGSSLYLGFTEIEALPENFSIKGDLDLKYSKIKILPDNLSVGTGLYLDKIQNIAYRKNCEDNPQIIFACWVNDGFAIQMNDFFGTFQEFEKMVDEKYSGEISIKYKKMADTCIKELTEKLKIL